MPDNPLEDFSDYHTNSMNNPTGFTSPPPFYSKRPDKPIMTTFKLFPKRKQFHQPKLIIELPHFIPHQYNTQRYRIFELSIQLQMTKSLITLLSMVTLTALSKYTPKQMITLFIYHLFTLKSFCSQHFHRTLASQIQLS